MTELRLGCSFIDDTHTLADINAGHKTLAQPRNGECRLGRKRRLVAFAVTGHGRCHNLADLGHVYSPKIKFSSRASWRVSASSGVFWLARVIAQFYRTLDKRPNAKPEILKGGVVYADPAICSSPNRQRSDGRAAKSSRVRQSKTYRAQLGDRAPDIHKLATPLLSRLR